MKFSLVFVFPHYAGVTSHTDLTQTLTLELSPEGKSDYAVLLAACGTMKEKT